MPGHRFHVLGDEDALSVQDRERIGRRQAFGREVLRRQESQHVGIAPRRIGRPGCREPAGNPVGAVGAAYEDDAEVELLCRGDLDPVVGLEVRLQAHQVGQWGAETDQVPVGIDVGPLPELVRRVIRRPGGAGDAGATPFLEKGVCVLDVEIGLTAPGGGVGRGGGQMQADSVPLGEPVVVAPLVGEGLEPEGLVVGECPAKIGDREDRGEPVQACRWAHEVLPTFVNLLTVNSRSRIRRPSARGQGRIRAGGD